MVDCSRRRTAHAFAFSARTEQSEVSIFWSCALFLFTFRPGGTNKTIMVQVYMANSVKIVLKQKRQLILIQQ